jgi:hypothetical protein
VGGRKMQNALQTSAGVLVAAGGVFAPDTLVIFNDSDGAERDPEPAASLGSALEMLDKWPSGGGTTFLFRGERLFLYFIGTEPYVVEAVSLSLGSRHFFRDVELRESFLSLCRELHRALNSTRTVVSVDLLGPSSKWPGYIKESRAGQLAKGELLDLP